jgi:hypothetical protein
MFTLSFFLFLMSSNVDSWPNPTRRARKPGYMTPRSALTAKSSGEKDRENIYKGNGSSPVQMTDK